MECSREKAVEMLGQQLQGLEEAICAAEAELQVASGTPHWCTFHDSSCDTDLEGSVPSNAAE